jgi:hypothetical protein
VIEDLGLARLGLWDEGLIQDIEHILADFLELGLNLLTIITDGANMLVRALRFLLLLDRRDDAPRSTSGADHVLVGDREQVSFVDGEFSTKLFHVRICSREKKHVAPSSGSLTYVGDLLHVCDHFIIALGLLTEPGQEGFAGLQSDRN